MTAHFLRPVSHQTNTQGGAQHPSLCQNVSQVALGRIDPSTHHTHHWHLGQHSKSASARLAMPAQPQQQAATCPLLAPRIKAPSDQQCTGLPAPKRQAASPTDKRTPVSAPSAALGLHKPKPHPSPWLAHSATTPLARTQHPCTDSHKRPPSHAAPMHEPARLLHSSLDKPTLQL
jgi:hypothetical protein